MLGPDAALVPAVRGVGRLRVGVVAAAGAVTAVAAVAGPPAAADHRGLLHAAAVLRAAERALLGLAPLHLAPLPRRVHELHAAAAATRRRG